MVTGGTVGGEIVWGQHVPTVMFKMDNTFVWLLQVKIEYGHGEISPFKELSKRINLDFYFHVQETHVPSQESEKLV